MVQVLVEIIGEGIGDDFADAKQKGYKMKEKLETVYPGQKLKVIYEDEGLGISNVAFYVVKEISKK